MSEEGYDFEKAKQGPVVRPSLGKTRITIRVDTDVLNWFRNQVHKRGGGNYRTLINDALREYTNLRDSDLEKTVRKVIREELKTLVKQLSTAPTLPRRMNEPSQCWSVCHQNCAFSEIPGSAPVSAFAATYPRSVFLPISSWYSARAFSMLSNASCICAAWSAAMFSSRFNWVTNALMSAAI